MNNHCKYKIIPSLNLIVKYFSGNLSELEIISLNESTMIDSEFNSDFNVLDVFTDANFNITDEGIHVLFKWFKSHYSSNRKSALLTDTPNQVVNILKFNYRHSQELPMRINIYSTLKAALSWIDLSSENEAEILKVINELKK